MPRSNLAHIMADAWADSMRTSPDPMRGDWLAETLGWVPRRTYRQWIDACEINVYGEVIPRIERVKRHLLMLGPTRLDPSRLR